MTAVALTDLPAALIGHLCTAGLCDAATHGVEVDAPRHPCTVDTLDMLAATAGVVIAVMEPSLTEDRYVIRWSVDAPLRVGTELVRWLVAQGRRDEARAAAHRLQLITDESFEAAWMAGTDPLDEMNRKFVAAGPALIESGRA